MQTMYNEIFYYTHSYFNAGVEYAFYEKSQIVNVFRFMGHMVSIAAIQPCHYNMKAATAKNGWGCIQHTLFIKNRQVTEFDPQVIL